MSSTDASSPLRILHLTAGSDAGGLSRYIHQLCTAMTALGHQTVVAGERGAWHNLFENAPWPWIDLPLKGGPVALWKSSKILVDYLQQHPADVIHTHYRRATLVARRVAKSNNVPILFTLHLPDISVRGPWKWFTDLGDCIHVPSHEAHDWIMKHFQVPSEKIALIPHGLDPSTFPVASDQEKQTARKQLGIDSRCTVAAFVGRFDVSKNEDWMLDLAHAAKTRLPELIILMQGEGPHETSLRNRIINERLDQQIHLLARGDPKLCYAACDALLLPSSREGFSYVSLEAMLTGRPVLRTSTGGASLQVIEGVTGQTIPVDKQIFVNSAIHFLSDKAALQKMGGSAAMHARKKFTFEIQLQKTIKLYQRLSGGDRQQQIQASPVG